MAKIGRPFRRIPRIRPRTAAVRTLTATALLLPLTACGDPSGGGNSPSPQGGTAAKRPSAASAWKTRPASIAALGDSITVAFDACTVLADCLEVSWATGTDPQVGSLARRLVKTPATHSWNLAKTGAVVADLPGQVDAAIEHRPELVTVLIGANDACRSDVSAMTPAASFRAEFEASLKKLRQALPKTQVYVAGVPDLMRLWEEGRKSQASKDVWKLGICQSMLRAPDDLGPAAVQRRKSVQDRVVAYNAALKDVCAKDGLCRYDKAVFDYRFTAGQLSAWDWFHPSKQGQRELAEMAYREITREESGTP